MQRIGTFPNTVALRDIPTELHGHPQPGARRWWLITSESDKNSFSLTLLLAFYPAGLSSHAKRGRRTQSLPQPGKVQTHTSLSRGCPKPRAADAARLRGKASPAVQPRHGHSSKGMLQIRSKCSAGFTGKSLAMLGIKDSDPLGCCCKMPLVSA